MVLKFTVFVKDGIYRLSQIFVNSDHVFYLNHHNIFIIIVIQWLSGAVAVLLSLLVSVHAVSVIRTLGATWTVVAAVTVHEFGVWCWCGFRLNEQHGSKHENREEKLHVDFGSQSVKYVLR